MVLEVDLGLGRHEKIEIYEGESAYDIAERCLEKYRSSAERIEVLAAQIESLINSYCKEIRSFIQLGNKDSPGTDTERSNPGEVSMLRNASSKTVIVNSSTEYESGSLDITSASKLERKPSFNNLPLQMPDPSSAALRSSRQKNGKMLFKLQVKVSGTRGDLIVRHGDSLEEVASKFASEHNLDSSSKSRVLELLKQAGARHKNKLRNDVVY